MNKKFIVVLAIFCFSVIVHSQNQSIKVLSWNIFMIPPIIYKSCQVERAPLIADMVKQLNPDVIVFQEAFQKKVRVIIWDKLKVLYPYESGVTKGGFFRTNSGVWVLSKYPIERKESIVYKKRRSYDRLAKKGATLVEVNLNGNKFQIIGTHVQSGNRFQATRNIQYKQLIDELGNKFLDPGIPQIIVGDLNTDYFETKDYKDMITILDVTDIKHTGEPFSNHGTDNDLCQKFFDGGNETIDYILLRNQHKDIATIKSEVIYSSKQMDSCCKRGFKSLSDHSPVMAELEMR